MRENLISLVKEETLFEFYKENVCTFVERSMKKNKIRHL